MLLQSHAGEIDLLPALPNAWASGSLTGMRARGGFEVDISWRDGTLTGATIRNVNATAGCKVRYGPKTLDFRLGRGESKNLGRNLEEL